MDALWIGLVVIIFLIFLMSWSFRGVPSNVGLVLVRATRWAVFCSPAIAGGEGFALPMPFFIAAPINATFPSLLPVYVLAPFAATWALFVAGQYGIYRFNRADGRFPP